MKEPILLVEGTESFAYIIESIDQAQVSVLIRMFIWRDDIIGNKVARAVLEAANRGVEITIIKDKLGCLFEYAEETRQSLFHKNISLIDKSKAWFLDKAYPMQGKGHIKQEPSALLDQMIAHENITIDCDTYYKDHSKYYIIDGKLLIFGGINIEDKEIYTDCEGRHYHDYMMAIESEEHVTWFQNRLKSPWQGFIDTDIDYFYNVNIGGQIHYGAKKAVLDLLSQVKKSITLVMAYISDQEILDQLVDMSNRGIDVRIIVAEKANLQQDVNMYYMAYLMKASDNKIKVYLNQKMVHAKLMWIDESLLSFGSTNLNKQAMEQLCELNVVMDARGQVKEKMQTTIQNEIAMATAISDYKQIHYSKIRAFLERIMC